MRVEDTLSKRWDDFLKRMHTVHQKDFSIEGILMLIGLEQLQEWSENYSKEQKKDLIHIGTCCILSQSGYYEKTHMDEDGWPHFKKQNALPSMSLQDQENFIKDHILLYMQTQKLAT